MGVSGLASSNESLLALLLLSSLNVSIFTATGEAEGVTHVLWEGIRSKPSEKWWTLLQGQSNLCSEPKDKMATLLEL